MDIYECLNNSAQHGDFIAPSLSARISVVSFR